jgi:YD repeat-containing protein
MKKPVFFILLGFGMKKFIYFLLLSFFIVLVQSIEGKAQTSYTFTYDASGNRLSRTISLKNASISQNDTVVAIQKTFEDLIGNCEVKIYPNPTKGLLKVEIPFTEEISATIGIFTLQGALVKKQDVKSTFTEIDLNKQPSGIFILRIGIGDLSSDWKIVKE